MSDISDWEAVPVKGGGKGAPAAQSNSNISDWDAVPVKAEKSPTVATKGGIAAIYNRPDMAAGEATLNVGTSMIAKPVSDIAGLAATGYEMATGGKHGGDPAAFKQFVQDSLTYEPKGEMGKALAEYNPMTMIGKGWGLIGGLAGDAIKTGSPGAIRTAAGNAVAEAIPQAVGILGAKAGAQASAAKTAQAALKPMPEVVAPPVVSRVPAVVRQKMQADFEAAKANAPAGQTAPVQAATPSPAQPQPAQGGLQSAGAAAASHAAQAEASGAPAALVDAIRNAEKTGDVNATAAQRHIEAGSLPVPVRITAGQATGDVNLLSHERNIRGAHPELADRFNSQNGELVSNLDAIRDRAAPDVYAANHVESGQAIIDSYKTKDAALNADISANYKALEDANGGQFPVDGQAFVANAEKALAKKMKGRYVPAEIQADMDLIKSGGAMTYENFENMRTNLAAEARKAERAGDGNKAMATALVRDALESIPITGNAAALKPLADAARASAKARFDLLKADPAYKAAVNDSIAADQFVSRFVVNGHVKNVKTMRQNLAADPLAEQHIAAAAMNYLQNRALGTGNKFSQSGFNRGMQAIGPKLPDLMPGEQAAQLQTLGKVARYTQEQPEGAYVNNSNTMVANAANAAKRIAAGAIDVKTLGVSKFVRESMAKNREKKEVAKSLAPGAGVKLSDFPK